jgi:pimeloyl-ACP methyl ester carboxylesterase
MIEEVEFPSEGTLLRGLLFLPPARKTKPPVIVMAHGTSATIRMVADKYAEAFCRAGLAVLLYDHRNFGSSGGEPRQEINPWVQSRGYLSAIDFVDRLDTVDPQRIGIWGDSYTGAQVIVVGAIDPRVKAIVAQCPACGTAPPSIEPSRAVFEQIKETLLHGDVRGALETTTGPLPVVSSDQVGTPSLLKPIQAYRWFIDYGGRAGTGWINNITRVLPDTPAPYSPVLCAPFVKAPILMMVAPEDEMVHANYAVAQLAYHIMPGPKRWHDIEGGHFGLLYCPGETFDVAVRVQTGYLRQWLAGASASKKAKATDPLIAIDAGLGHY